MVTASQPGNAIYAPATPVVRTVTIKKAPTSLKNRPVSIVGSLLKFRIKYTAVLTSDATGKPLVGQTISFSTSNSSTGQAVCTAVTNKAGKATCSSGLLKIRKVLRTGSTTARFAGSANYASSTDTTPFKVL